MAEYAVGIEVVECDTGWFWRKLDAETMQPVDVFAYGPYPSEGAALDDAGRIIRNNPTDALDRIEKVDFN